jgi:replicative DNA helicase
MSAKKNTKNEQSNVKFRLPKHNLEMERAVLCCCMIDPKAVARVATILNNPEIFYDRRHQIIYTAILQLFGMAEPIDVLTVSEELRQFKELEAAGGDPYLASLTGEVATSAHVEHYAAVVHETYVHRSTASLLESSLFNLYETTDTPAECVATVIESLIALKNQASREKNFYDARELTTMTLDNIKIRIENLEKGIAPGIPSGVDDIDSETSGWQPGEYIIIAGRPSSGKTDLALNCAYNSALEGYPSLFFSLEMGVNVWNRISSLVSNIYRGKIRSGSMSHPEFIAINQKADKMSNLPILVSDRSDISIEEIRAILVEALNRIQIKQVFVDYLQLIKPSKLTKGQTKEQEVTHISHGLKNISREFNLTVIALSQLNRAVELRKERDPQLSDLRDSGSLEQDADIVIFITQPNEDEEKKDAARMNIAKFREGRTKKLDPQYYNRGIGRFGRSNRYDAEVEEPPDTKPVSPTPLRKDIDEDDNLPF